MIVGDWPNPEHAPLIEKMERMLAQETGLTNIHIASFSIGVSAINFGILYYLIFLFKHSMAWYIHGAFMLVLLSSCYATILVNSATFNFIHTKNKKFLYRTIIDSDKLSWGDYFSNGDLFTYNLLSFYL
jgi:hypothetical protein